jgi:hypothetical protein
MLKRISLQIVVTRAYNARVFSGICKKSLVPRSGPSRRIIFESEYLGEFETELEKKVRYGTGA